MIYLATAVLALMCIGAFIFVGIIIGTNRLRKAIEDNSVGDLRIDRSIPEDPPRPCLEIYRGNSIESISKKDFVILKVVNEDYLSRD